MCMFMPGAYARGNAEMPGWDKLTNSQKAELQLQAAKAADFAIQKEVKSVSPDDVQKWVNIGKNIGIGFAATAKELGIGIDELMKTDTGKIAMFLIVWHYIGETFVGYLFGGIWFLIALPAWAYYMRRWLLVPTYTWHENGKKASFTYEKATSDQAVSYFTAVLIGILVIGFVIMF